MMSLKSLLRYYLQPIVGDDEAKGLEQLVLFTAAITAITALTKQNITELLPLAAIVCRKFVFKPRHKCL